MDTTMPPTPLATAALRDAPQPASRVDPRTLVEPLWVPPIERIAPRIASLFSRRPLRFGEATNRLAAYVYGNLVILAALITLQPADVANGRGAITILAAGLSTFIAHSFSDVLARRVGHGHRSVLHAGLHAARTSLPIATSAVVPVVLLGFGAYFGWPAGSVALAAELFVCTRIGFIGAMAERYRGRTSSHRFILVGAGIAVTAAAVAVAKALITGG